jgi:hypothetical protein
LVIASEIASMMCRDMGATIFAALDLVASQIVDEAVSGSEVARRSVIEERGGMSALRIDALLQIAERILAAEPAAAERGDVGRLQLNLDTEAVAEIGDEAGESGEQTLEGQRISSEVAQRWACDVRTSVLLEHEGHAHHIKHWAWGGPTELDNLVSLCGFHHHLVHEGGWTVALSNGAVIWSDPGGIPATVEPLTGEPGAVTEVGRVAGVAPHSIESRWHNDRLDFGFVVSVIAEYCLRQRRRGESVPAGTSSPAG